MDDVTPYYAAVQRILYGVTCDTMRMFSAQTTDADRVKFMGGLECVRGIFDVTPPSSDKSGAESTREREVGNESYQQREYAQALSHYNRSVLLAPLATKGVSQELVLALGNRSAALYQLQRYRECLADVELAVRHRYPTALAYKLFDRKGRCLMALGRTNEASAAFLKVCELLGLSNLDANRRQALRESTARQIDACALSPDDNEGISGLHGVGNNRHLPSVSGNRSRVFANASDAFDLKFSPDCGRFVTASRDVRVGEFVLVEKPYASVLDCKHYDTRCFHCFVAVDVPVPCTNCARVRYCSETCRKASWDAYHARECRFLPVLLASGTGNLSLLTLRLMLVTGLRRLLKHNATPNTGSVFTDAGGCYRGGYGAVYNLVTQTQYRTPNTLLQYTILALFITETLRKMDFFGGDDVSGSDDRISRVGGAILRFLQIVSCNGVEVMQLDVQPQILRSTPERIGLALYATAALVNHSCNPAMEVIFYGDACAMRATCNTASSDELTIDYGYLYYSTTREERHKFLSEQYFFECLCDACVNNWGVKSALPGGSIPPLKCVRCQHRLSLTQREGKDPTKVKCRKCALVQNPLAYLDRLQESTAAVEKTLQTAKATSPVDAIPALERHVTLMDKYVMPPWRDYVTYTSTLKQCYRMLGNVKVKQTSATSMTS
ncbi:hypothetical protein NP493_710g01020 [Ridgeia piscesae]|uniref:Protein-lysine N-methyltransferase SMYD4 n=1 Tax=Ridgeia piscesae TaxID=27915 RepID=A0AAD9KQA1_RIDPI|nr:hypothetical protein NP493_710g01020 [Ridgeia piscesae]